MSSKRCWAHPGDQISRVPAWSPSRIVTVCDTENNHVGQFVIPEADWRSSDNAAIDIAFGARVASLNGGPPISVFLTINLKLVDGNGEFSNVGGTGQSRTGSASNASTVVVSWPAVQIPVGCDLSVHAHVHCVSGDQMALILDTGEGGSWLEIGRAAWDTSLHLDRRSSGEAGVWWIRPSEEVVDIDSVALFARCGDEVCFSQIVPTDGAQAAVTSTGFPPDATEWMTRATNAHGSEHSTGWLAVRDVPAAGGATALGWVGAGAGLVSVSALGVAGALWLRGRRQSAVIEV